MKTKRTLFLWLIAGCAVMAFGGSLLVQHFIEREGVFSQVVNGALMLLPICILSLLVGFIKDARQLNPASSGAVSTSVTASGGSTFIRGPKLVSLVPLLSYFVLVSGIPLTLYCVLRALKVERWPEIALTAFVLLIIFNAFQLKKSLALLRRKRHGMRIDLENRAIRLYEADLNVGEVTLDEVENAAFYFGRVTTRNQGIIEVLNEASSGEGGNSIALRLKSGVNLEAIKWPNDLKLSNPQSLLVPGLFGDMHLLKSAIVECIAVSTNTDF